MPRVAVEFENVTKTFRMRNRSDALRDAIPRLVGRFLKGRRAKEKRHVALDGVSFSVRSGEVLGVVGANGAGKSTTLRLAAGIYPPNSGKVRVDGRISALIELGAGFHPDLSGRENIYLAGALHGLRRKEVAAVFDEIAEFADIGEYLESPVRTYSSGMAVRLGFAAAVLVPAEILLVDEVLAVGDMEFRERCLRRMSEKRQGGAAVLFVSHNLFVVEQFCDRVVFLHHGRVVADGPAKDSLAVYRQHVAEDARVGSVRESASPQLRRGTGRLVLENVRISGGAGSPEGSAASGGRLEVRAAWKTLGPVEAPIFGIQIHTGRGELCAHLTTEGETGLPRRFDGEGEVALEIPDLRLLPGGYELSVFALESGGLAALDLHQCLYLLRVEGERSPARDGIVALESRWKIHGAADGGATAP